jgi:hypothetical protein
MGSDSPPYVPRRSATRDSRCPDRFHNESQTDDMVEFSRDEVRGLDQPSDGLNYTDAAVERRKILKRQGTFVYKNFLIKCVPKWTYKPAKSLTEEWVFYAPHVQREDAKEGSTKFTGYESIGKQFRSNNQDAMEILINAGHNIQEEQRRVILDKADKAIQRIDDPDERSLYMPGRGAGPSSDSMELDEPCGADCPSDDGGDVITDTEDEDEATVAFGTSDSEDDADKKPPAKASRPPHDTTETDDVATAAFDPNDDKKPPARASAMGEQEDKKPPAKASLPQKNAGKQGAAAPTAIGKNKSLPKSGHKVYACNKKKAVASKKKSASSTRKPSRVKSSVAQDNQRPRLRPARGSTSTSGRSNPSPLFAASSSSSSTGGDGNKENDAPTNNQRRKSLRERLVDIEAGLGLSSPPSTSHIAQLPTLQGRVQRIEREVLEKVTIEGTSLIDRVRMLEHEVLG